MKKALHANFLLLICISLCLALISGCAGNQKQFSGHWIGKGIYHGFNQTPECIYDVTIENIEKNGSGNNYLVSINQGWSEKKVDVDLMTNQRHITAKWAEKKHEKLVGTVKDKNLYIQVSDPTMQVFLTQIDKNGTLQLTIGSDVISLHKAKDGEVDELKKELEAKS